MQSPISSSMGLKPWLLLIILSILWGGSFFFIEVAVAELPTLTIVFCRLALASVVLWLFSFISGISIPKSPAVWASFLVMGLLNNLVPFSLIVWGQTHIASGLASILIATTPLFTVLVANVLLQDEKITSNKLVGVGFGFAGTVVMIGPSMLEGIGLNVIAHLAVLGAALSYAFAGVYGRRYKSQAINPIVIAAGQVSASALFLAPIALIVDNPMSMAMPSSQTVFSIIALAVLSTGVAYVLFFKLLATVGATNVMLVTFLSPVSAILLGIVVLNESLEILHVVGMLIIMLGLIAIDGRLWAKLREYLL